MRNRSKLEENREASKKKNERGSFPLREAEAAEQVEGPGDAARRESGLEKIYLAGL